MANHSRRIKLRAFKIENPNLTEANSGILPLLKSILTDTSIASQRRMKLNEDDEDEDLLSNFTWHQDNIYLFGMMLRVIPAENGGVISEELFNQHTITIADVTTGNPAQSQYKNHYYFALNNNYLVTNLAGNINIDRVQTYINWLLNSVRGGRYFQLTELTKLPDGVPLSQISQIEFVGGGSIVNATPTSRNPEAFSTKMIELTNDVLSYIVSDADSLDQIRSSQLVEAKLFLKMKGKPKELAQEDFQRVMGAIATNITNDSGIILKTKDGNKYTGETVKVKKEVEVERTTGNRIVEEQLKQKMEVFLTELRAQENG